MCNAQKVVELKKLPNIGKKTVQRLLEIGIETSEQLREFGPEEIFLQIFEKNGWEQGMCSCFLYALEGAITGERWNEISEVRKKELVAFVHSVRKSLPGMT